jgi:excisionase family DNA binding protein
MQQFLTIDEVAGILRLDPPAVTQLLEVGELGGIRLPTGELRIGRDDLKIFIRARHLDLTPTAAEGSRE